MYLSATTQMCICTYACAFWINNKKTIRKLTQKLINNQMGSVRKVYKDLL